MGYFVTDPSLIALANAGLPPDEQVGGYYQMDEHEIARAASVVHGSAHGAGKPVWHGKGGRLQLRMPPCRSS